MSDILAIEVPSISQNERLEELAYHHGQAYDSYLSTERNLEKFWASDKNSVLAYAKVGRNVHVQGGLLGSPEDRPLLLKEFLAFVQKNEYVATFYNIGESELSLFRDESFQITKWGEEPLLDVQNLTWSGHEYEWVRRQANYCRRQNSVVTECCRENYSDCEWADLMDNISHIAGECLSSKPQRGEVKFFNGSIDPPEWARRRLFISRSNKGHGPIEGFLICLPYDGGQRWAVETYRHRRTAPRGVVAFMIHQAAERLKSEGIQSISLCLCPAVRYERLKNDSWIIRRCLQFGFNYASAFFDMPGEYHFKSRFRPRFVRRFICHWPEATVGSMLSTVQLSAALDIDLRKLVRNLWHRLFHPKTRRNLALPKEVEPVVKESAEWASRRSEERMVA